MNLQSIACINQKRRKLKKVGESGSDSSSGQESPGGTWRPHLFKDSFKADVAIQSQGKFLWRCKSETLLKPTALSIGR